MDTATGKVVGTGDLRLIAYPGDNMVLLAMSLDGAKVSASGAQLAGFAIFRTVKGKPEEALLNRLNFATKVTAQTTPEQRKWTSTNEAPIQKFRWVDVPADGFTDSITYRVVAKYFTGKGLAMRDGETATATVTPANRAHSKFQVAFTRGYASSQAYVDKFDHKDIRPTGPKKPQFDTAPFLDQYVWLGADARKQLMMFLDDCAKDTRSKVDVFAYDLDEPDVIKAICTFGQQKRLRAVLDNAPLHTKAGAVEPQAAKLIKAAAGADNVKQGHFNRFQHNKVFIKRDSNGNAQKVLFGSMNFSLRGLYVQANNVMVLDDPTSAAYFARAFDNAFANNVKTKPFQDDQIAADYNPISAATTPALPLSAVSLSPHSHSIISLGRVAAAIQQAQSSVLYAVMAPTGSGDVLACLRAIAAKPIIFSYGTVETDKGLAVQDATGEMGSVTSFAFLKAKVPPPFQAEWSGGNGMHIHHKFIVVDFNDKDPVVFTGSSNLAAGGEEANGDSLIMIKDPFVASMYAIEAVRLFDHYAFRKYMQTATETKPLTLWYPGKANAPTPWYKPYYDTTSVKLRDRCLFADVPLPAGLQTQKNPDWKSLLAEASAGAGKAAGKKTAGTGKGAKKKPATKTNAPAKKVAKKRPAKKVAKKRPAKKAAKKRPAKKAAKKRPAKKAAKRSKG